MESAARNLHRVSMCMNIQAGIRRNPPVLLLLTLLFNKLFFIFPPLEYSNLFHLCSSEVSFASSLIAYFPLGFGTSVLQCFVVSGIFVANLRSSLKHPNAICILVSEVNMK